MRPKLLFGQRSKADEGVQLLSMKFVHEVCVIDFKVSLHLKYKLYSKCSDQCVHMAAYVHKVIRPLHVKAVIVQF